MSRPDPHSRADGGALFGTHPVPGDRFEGEVRVEAVRFRSEDGGFAVLEVGLDDGSEISAVGPLGHLEEGGRAKLSGAFEEHATHGIQIRARSAEPLDPASSEGARRYLISISNIGPSRADALLRLHGDDLFAAIDADPVSAFARLRGMNAERAEQAAADWEDRRAQRRLYALLAPHGLARYVGELVAVHGSGAAEAVRREPYGLTEIHGIGFQSADRLALDQGIAPDAPARVQAAAVHALEQAESRGHTHLPLRELVGAMRGLLGAAVEPSMGLITAHPELTVEDALVYRSWTWESERWLGAALGGMARAQPAWRKPPSPAETEGLTDAQREAVTNAFTRRLSVVTGGPGTGKTHLTEAISRLADAREVKLRMVAPTGRAARRLTQATGGAPASTIHKALEWIPGEFPGRDEDNPIEADLVIVDEASMLSLEIARFLLAGIGPDTHLAWIGDADQLPPVGPGKPFVELIEAGICPTVRLGHIFRQARQSMIVGAAHAIRGGRPPRGKPAIREDGVEEVHDFFVHGRRSAGELAADVVTMATERIPAKWDLDPVRDVQVLAPQYRGPLGIDALHEQLSDRLCGSAERVVEGRFRVGEKVVITRSLPEHDIANGTMFVIDSADEEEGVLYLETELGELLELPQRDARSLRGGFCVSVHKAQGFEIPAVVVCLHSSHVPQLLSRNLLYTAVTRARKLCVLAADEGAIRRALANTDAADRHSRLGERLSGRARREDSLP